MLRSMVLLTVSVLNLCLPYEAEFGISKLLRIGLLLQQKSTCMVVCEELLLPGTFVFTSSSEISMTSVGFLTNHGSLLSSDCFELTSKAELLALCLNSESLSFELEPISIRWHIFGFENPSWFSKVKLCQNLK